MMLMLNLSIGSSPIATHRTHYLGPFGQRADIALPSHCQPVAGFFRASHALPFNVEPFTLK